MTTSLFKDWFFNHFVTQVKGSFKSLGLPEDSIAILLLDNCKAHPSAAGLVSGNIFGITLLPPNVTSLIQPMDQRVIQNFKSFYRSFFVQGRLNTGVTNNNPLENVSEEELSEWTQIDSNEPTE